MSWTRSPALLATGAVLALATPACGGDDKPPPTAATPAPQRAAAAVAGGETTLELSRTSRRVLELAGVDVTALGRAELRDGGLRFPITGGELSLQPRRGTIDHAGGVRFRARGKNVDATRLRFDPANSVVTAVVEGRRTPLLRLDADYPRELPPTGQDVVIAGGAAVFGSTIVALIAEQLDVPALTEGLPLGQLRISART